MHTECFSSCRALKLAWNYLAGWSHDHHGLIGLPVHYDQRRTSLKYRTRIIQLALALFASAGLTTISQAETGSVRVVFAKAGLIVGAGAGRGVLTFRGHDYPFRVSGMSLGATIGGSVNKLIGRALNLQGPRDIAGTYSTLGAGASLGGGVGGVRLQNASGVILQLHGVKAGVELSANLGGITITLE
jgi:hypothetical protein